VLLLHLLKQYENPPGRLPGGASRFCTVDAEKAEGICLSGQEMLTRVLSGTNEFLKHAYLKKVGKKQC